jgi:tRNA (cmo5U34)-methyltransferase
MNLESNISRDEHYLSMAREYDERVKIILPGSEQFFSSCLSFIPDGEISLLELGSGTGYATLQILDKNPDTEIICIDHSPEMIRCARQKPVLDKVRIIEQDIMVSWPDKRFDVVMTTLCLHHIKRADRELLLKRVHGILAEGGVFICGDIIRPETEESERIYRERWVNGMLKAGLSEKETENIATSRQTNYPAMESISSFYKTLKQTGFSVVLMPYKSEISAVFIGYR